MTTFVYVIAAIVIIASVSIVAWVVTENHEADQEYEKAIDDIYSRKRDRKAHRETL